MPPNGPAEWRARIGQWENRKLRWYQAHCRSRQSVKLHLLLWKVILEVPLFCVLLLLLLTWKVVTDVSERGNRALFTLGKLFNHTRCCTVRLWNTPLIPLLALSLLLMIAGDVETNPGPVSGEQNK